MHAVDAAARRVRLRAAIRHRGVTIAGGGAPACPAVAEGADDAVAAGSGAPYLSQGMPWMDGANCGGCEEGRQHELGPQQRVVAQVGAITGQGRGACIGVV